MNDKTSIFTIVLDFQEGTYLHQCCSDNAKNALIIWIDTIEKGEIEGLDEAQCQILRKMIHDDDPTNVIRLQSVWCLSALLKEELVLINVIRTKT